MPPTTASVLVRFLADTKGFATGIQGVQSTLNKFQSSVKAGLGILGGGFVVRGLVNMIQSTADSADKIRDLSIAFGVSTEALSELKFAAEQSGASFEELGVGIKTLQKGIGELVATGGGEAMEAFERLGGGVLDLAKGGAKLEDVLVAVSKQFKGLSDQEKVFVASKLFGRGAATLIPLLSEDMKELMETARRLNLTLSREAADAADAWNDSVGEMKAAWEGFKKSVILDSGFLKALTETLRSLQGQGGGGSQLNLADKAVLRFEQLIGDKARAGLGGIRDLDALRKMQDEIKDLDDLRERIRRKQKEKDAGLAAGKASLERGDFVGPPAPLAAEDLTDLGSKFSAFFSDIASQGKDTFTGIFGGLTTATEIAVQDLDTFESRWTELVEELHVTGGEVAELMIGTFQAAADGIGHAVAQAIVYGEDLGESLEEVFKSIAEAVIAQLISLGIQELIYLVLTLLGATQRASSQVASYAATGAAAAGATVASAAAAFASEGGIPGAIAGLALLATIPVVAGAAGAAIVGAAAGSGAAGAAAGAAAVPFAEGGIVTAPMMGLVGEAGPEAIIPLGRFERLFGDFDPGGRGDVVTVVEADGRTLARIVAPNVPGIIRRRLGGRSG